MSDFALEGEARAKLLLARMVLTPITSVILVLTSIFFLIGFFGPGTAGWFGIQPSSAAFQYRLWTFLTAALFETSVLKVRAKRGEACPRCLRVLSSVSFAGVLVITIFRI